jgi:hypothetical protein
MSREGEVQISAVITRPTRELLERYSRATGVKKGHLLEMALLHHLRAIQEIPPEFIIPPRLVVSKGSGKALIASIRKPRKPTKAMRELLRGE